MKLKVLCTDNGGEFTSMQFSEYCAGEGIQRHYSAPYSTQQNGVVERQNQMIVNTARSILRAWSMLGYFWGEAVHTVVFLLNRAPTNTLDGLTPYQAWYKKKPPVHFLKVFGCVAYIKNLRPHLSKLDDHGQKVVFISYQDRSKVYRFYDPVTKRVHVSRDTIFNESARWDWGEALMAGSEDTFMVEYDYDLRSHDEVAIPRSSSLGTPPSPGTPPSTGAPTAPDTTSTPTSPSTAPRAVTPRPATPPTGPHIEFATPLTTDLNFDADDKGKRELLYRTLDNIHIVGATPGLVHHDVEEAELYVVSVEEPRTLKEADGDPNWVVVMEEELASIHDNNTWSLAEIPRGHRAIGLKSDKKGNIVKYKARLVAKGYVQQPGVDFDKVFAPVARLEFVRLLLAIAAHYGWGIHHMDVKSTFLNGELQEEVYVQQPPGFIKDKHKNMVLKLHKALYGLRQAPCAWNQKLDAELLALGFTHCVDEHRMYTRDKEGGCLIVCVYVDDLIITGGDVSVVAKFKV
jgi:hypothetical protein